MQPSEATAPAAYVTANVTEVLHPLVQHKLGLLRDKTTPTQVFRQLAGAGVR